MASTLVAMASNLVAMASTLEERKKEWKGLQVFQKACLKIENKKEKGGKAKRPEEQKTKRKQ